MLIIDKNSVYEIDEECLKRRKMPRECDTMEKVEKRKQQNAEKERQEK